MILTQKEAAKWAEILKGFSEGKEYEIPLVLDKNTVKGWAKITDFEINPKQPTIYMIHTASMSLINVNFVREVPHIKNKQKQPITEKQKNCIDWIEKTTGAVYEGGSVSDFISEHIEEARFQSELDAEANDTNG